MSNRYFSQKRDGISAAVKKRINTNHLLAKGELTLQIQQKDLICLLWKILPQNYVSDKFFSTLYMEVEPTKEIMTEHSNMQNKKWLVLSQKCTLPKPGILPIIASMEDQGHRPKFSNKSVHTLSFFSGCDLPGCWFELNRSQISHVQSIQI